MTWLSMISLDNWYKNSFLCPIEFYKFYIACMILRVCDLLHRNVHRRPCDMLRTRDAIKPYNHKVFYKELLVSLFCITDGEMNEKMAINVFEQGQSTH